MYRTLLCRSVLTGKDSERTARTEKVPQNRLLLLRNAVNGQFVRCIVKECIDASMGCRIGGKFYCRDVREGTPEIDVFHVFLFWAKRPGPASVFGLIFGGTFGIIVTDFSVTLFFLLDASKG